MTDTISLPAIGPGPAYQSVKIWLPQLILEAVQRGEGSIQGKTFTDCLFDGPAVIVPLGQCHFDTCDFGLSRGDMRNLLLSPMGPNVNGAIPFKDCTFVRCSFLSVAYTGSPEFLHEMSTNVAGAPQ
jgi:hypothetical protein